MKDKKKLKLATESAAQQPEPVAPPQEAAAVAQPPVRDRKQVEQDYNNILFDIGGKHFAIARTQQVIKELEGKASALLVEIQLLDLKASLDQANSMQAPK